MEWRNSGEGSGFTGVPEQQAFETADFDIGLNRRYWIDEFDANGNIAHVDQTPTDTVTAIPGAQAEPTFRDRMGSTPGIEGAPPNAFFIDESAGVVLPTKDDVPSWAYWDVFGDLGNPGLNALGVNLEVVEQAQDGTWARVKFWVDDDTVFVDKRANPEVVAPGGVTTYTISLKDASGSFVRAPSETTLTAAGSRPNALARVRLQDSRGNGGRGSRGGQALRGRARRPAPTDGN